MAYQFETQQGDALTLRYQQRYRNGTQLLALTPSDVASLTLSVYDVASVTATTPAGGVALVVGDCVLSSPPDGYNVIVTASGSYFPDANKVYQVQVLVTLTSGPTFYLEHADVRTTPTYTG